MDKPTVQVEIEPTLSQTGTFSEVEGGDTDEGPENDSDYRVEYDDDFYERLGEIELEKSDSGEDVLHDDDIKDELRELELEKSSQATELRDVSYFSSSGDEKIVEKFSKNLESYRPDEYLDLKALDDSELNLTSEFEITELQGLSRNDYFKIVGESSLMDYDDIKVVKKEASKIKRTRHRKILQEQQKDKDLKNEQLNQRKLLQEEQIQREQEQKAEQLRQEQIHQEQEQLLKERRMQEENSKEKNLQEQKEDEERDKEHWLQSEEETKLKEQLRQEQKQKLLQEEQLKCEEQKEYQLQTQSLQFQPKKNSFPPTQRSVHEDIFKSGIKSQNEPITPTTSFSMKSFHLPDISLSQQGDVREFRRMSNIFGNGDKGPVAALRTLTDNYRQLELDKRSADIKVGQLEKQLGQYHQLLRKEQVKSKVNNKEDWLETITYDVESSSRALSEKEKTDPSVVSLQKKYKVVKRQLEYMKTYSRKAEDERDEAKKALFKTQRDIAQMNDQFESLRASVQEPNKRNTQTSNIAATTLPASLSSELPANPLLSKRTVEPSNINRLKDNINIQGNKQIIEPKENVHDSISEKSKSVDPEQIKKIQEEIENSRVVRENLRKQRQAMDKMRRKKEVLESEENEDVPTNRLRGPQQFVFSHKGESRDQRKFENHEDSHKEKKKLTSHNEENRYTDFREQQYEETYDNSKAFNKQTAQFTNYDEDNQHGYYRKQHYYENYEDELHNRGLSKSSTFTDQNQYIDPREQQRYNEKLEDQRRDNYFTRLPKGNNQYFDTRKDGSFSEQEDGGQFPQLFRRQRQFFDVEEDSDIHPSDSIQSPARIGRLYSQYSNESRDNFYTHIKGRRQYHKYTCDNSEGESDHVENREELNSGEQSTSLLQDYPIWRDVKNSKSYLRKRNYVQEPLKPKPTRPCNIGREIPFILGTGTGKSHSVTVNLQKAFSFLKNHNPNSCTVCNKKNTNTSGKNKSKKQAEFKTQHSGAMCSEKDDESPDIALGRVICNLADELKHLKMHYSNLVEEYQMIDPLNSKSKRSALTEEMKEIMDQMEMKGDQIATLYDIQQKTVKPSLSSKSRYGLKSKDTSQKPTRQIRETRAESLGLLRGTQRVQKTSNDL